MAVRLRDVADHAGVSVKTVSNVVHGHPAVSRPMRSKVQASIEALGYVPNISARSLRTGRSGLIGLAVPRITDPYFCDVAAAVIDAAAARGLSVLVEQTGGEFVRENDVLLGRRPTIVDGLILSPISVSQAALDEASPGVPLVLLGEHLLASQRSRVAIDNVAASAQAVGHLLRLGRRRIVAVGAKRGSTAATAELRLAGYRRAMTEAGVERDGALEVATDDFTRAAGIRAVDDLVAAGTAFDALFCFNDLLALGAMEALRRHGLVVPGDVAVVGVDDIEEGRHSDPDLTTVAADLSVLAAAAVDSLVRRLDDPASPDGDSIVVPHRLVVRGSTAP
jgi:LacI family transcriptional regulator, repressor for deo operon, udp, cdd, tsx, nupC, and nupG